MKPTDTLNILIVDDEEIVRRTLTSILNRLGHTTDCAQDGLSGKEVLKNKKYDAAFIDMRMPGIDGMSLLKWSRQEQLNLPIIIMTGHGDEKARDEALQSGAFVFLKKPFSILEIKRLIEKIQDMSR